MSWIENLLIIAGISLDIFGAVECQGSLVKTINKVHLVIICGLVTLWQLAALFVGHFLSDWIYIRTSEQSEMFLGHAIAIVIFFGLGIRLMVKAVKMNGSKSTVRRILDLNVLSEW